MKKITINRPWQHLIIAISSLYWLSAVLHIISLLFQVVITRSLMPLGIVAVFDLQVFFPQIKSSFIESLFSLVVYAGVVITSLFFLRSVKITIEKK